MLTQVAWIASFVVDVLILLWIVRWGGAEWLRGHWLADVLICFGASTCDEDVIKFLAWALFILGTVWSIFGIFDPNMRLDLPKGVQLPLRS